MSADFNVSRFFPRRIMDLLTEVRVSRPKLLYQAAKNRLKRAAQTTNGKLLILACDHPGRGVMGALDDPLIMGNRQEYMGRAVRALLEPGFDGVMAHTDLIEDLIILDALLKEAGAPSLLDNRLVIGCMNRGGVHNVKGEIHDRFTSFSSESIERLNMDGGKMLIRVLNDDKRTLDTVAACADAVTALSRAALLAFVEPLPMKGDLGSYKANYSIDELRKWVGVCAGLGETSIRTWLKIPYIPGFDQVTIATTLPILVLGGPAESDPMPLLRDFSEALRSGGNVRGAMVGRNVLFPGKDDPLAMAAAVNAVIHKGAAANDAKSLMNEARGLTLDAIAGAL